MFNWKTLDHFYTENCKEATDATFKNGYVLEGTIGKVAANKPTIVNCENLTPIYRYYNGYDHFYTTNKQEGIDSGQYGYRSEGITGYCSPTENYCNATLKLHRCVNQFFVRCLKADNAMIGLIQLVCFGVLHLLTYLQLTYKGQEKPLEFFNPVTTVNINFDYLFISRC